MHWNDNHQQAAMAEGWLLADNSDHGLRIERFDNAARFADDASAIAYVGRRASFGDALHVRAFSHLATYHAVDDAAVLDHGT